VAEFNRYNSHKIIIRDARIAHARLSGRFRSSEYAAFVRLLVDRFAIEPGDGDNETILSERKLR
jgi:transmembrane sensor